jgi:protein arginine N-methyltransferase 5
MHIPAVILPPLPTTTHHHPDPLVALAPALQQLCHVAHQQSQTQLWIMTKCEAHDLQQIDRLYRLCDAPTNLGMVLWMTRVPTTHGAAASGASGSSAAGTSLASPSPTTYVSSQMILLHRAMALQLKAICFPTTVFLTNKRGYPTLSKSHQVLFTELLRRLGRTIRVLVHGPSVHPVSLAGASQCLPYLQYIRHLRQRPEVTTVMDTDEAHLEEGYLDQLQRPLQPLGDHLDFGTYETFERDPVKYAQYQQAILYCLRDGWQSLEHQVPTVVTIVVAGAGRGPLVQCALRALQQLESDGGNGGNGGDVNNASVPPQLSLKIFAVEKNPHAVLFLQSMVEYDATWRSCVQVIPKDMRHVSLKDLDQNRVDIVVSELLGSFGDNELSPECLKGFASSGPNDKTSVLKKTTIFIPSSYTSHLAPVSSYRLWTEARSLQSTTHATTGSNSGGGAVVDAAVAAMETPYVTRTHAASQTHPEQDAWTFVHPHDHAAPSLERYARLRFGPNITHGTGYGSGYGIADFSVAKMATAILTTTSTTSMMQEDREDEQQQQMEALEDVERWQGIGTNAITIHGFLGTFTAILYQSSSSSSSSSQRVEISTSPSHFSVGMYSWFPLWFPLHQPLHIPSGATLEVNLWRKTRDLKVWYEWCAQVIMMAAGDNHKKAASAAADDLEQVLTVTPIHNPNGRSSFVSM